MPAPLRRAVGKREIVVSLKTSDQAEARRLYLVAAKEAEDILRLAGSGQFETLSDEQLETLADSFIASEFPPSQRRPGGHPANPPSDDADLKARLRSFLARSNTTLPQLDLNNLFAQAQIAYQGEFPAAIVYRPGRTDDTAVRSLVASVPQARKPEPPAPVLAISAEGPRLSKVLQKWADERKPPAKTLSDWSMAIRRLREVIGGDVPVRSVTRRHVVQLKDALLKFPRNLSRTDRDIPVPEIVVKTANDDGLRRLSPAAVNKVLAGVRSVLEYARSNDLIEVNPAKGITALDPEDDRDKRHPYSRADLERIFRLPVFADAAPDPAQRTARFWLPVLGLLTGCRLNELGQALVSDVVDVGGTLCLDINRRHAGKHLKSTNAQRQVPLHPTLIEAGFVTYVSAIRSRGETRLFPDVRTKGKGPVTAPFSKWWGYYTDQHGLNDPKTSFHSFRHNFKDMCRAARIPEAVQNALLGHAQAGVGGLYGSGYPLGDLAEAVATIQPPICLDHLKLPSDS